MLDPEFYEYSGLLFKEAAGDFKAFSKKMIDSIGEGISDHVKELYDRHKADVEATEKETETEQRAKSAEDVDKIFDEGNERIKEEKKKKYV